jgi:hypothetical protein
MWHSWLNSHCQKFFRSVHRAKRHPGIRQKNEEYEEKQTVITFVLLGHLSAEQERF